MTKASDWASFHADVCKLAKSGGAKAVTDAAGGDPAMLAIAASVVYGQGHRRMALDMFSAGAKAGNSLAHAVMLGDLEVIKRALDEGEDPDWFAELAAWLGLTDVCKLFILHGADPDTMIGAAAITSNKALVDFLLDKGADPNKALLAATYG